MCGPLSLGDQVRSVVRGVDRKRMKAAGGIEIHDEYVMWFVFEMFFIWD